MTYDGQMGKCVKKCGLPTDLEILPHTCEVVGAVVHEGLRGPGLAVPGGDGLDGLQRALTERAHQPGGCVAGERIVHSGEAWMMVGSSMSCELRWYYMIYDALGQPLHSQCPHLPVEQPHERVCLRQHHWRDATKASVELLAGHPGLGERERQGCGGIWMTTRCSPDGAVADPQTSSLKQAPPLPHTHTQAHPGT